MLGVAGVCYGCWELLGWSRLRKGNWEEGERGECGRREREGRELWPWLEPAALWVQSYGASAFDEGRKGGRPPWWSLFLA